MLWQHLTAITFVRASMFCRPSFVVLLLLLQERAMQHGKTRYRWPLATRDVHLWEALRAKAAHALRCQEAALTEARAELGDKTRAAEEESAAVSRLHYAE